MDNAGGACTADAATAADVEVEDVYLVFKTHLDVGFTDLARTVVADYFGCFIPRALRVAEVLRQAERPERLVWTTGSWLIYEYLEQAGADERRRMEAAITAGDIAWHGLPFTMHSELLDPSLFEYGLRLSRELDSRFGRETIAAKTSDVPGHTRGIVPLLAAAGIRFLHIGVNPGCVKPDVPPVFVWRDENGAEVIVMYEPRYGGVGSVPGFPAVLAVEHTSDNAGPPSLDTILLDVFPALRRRYPGARVHASSMDDFVRAALPLKDRLPVVTEEIGDTWIHGVGSDPTKVSRFRELCRLRRGWLDDGRADLADPAFAAFSRRLLLVPEHTWGLDTKKHLGDWVNYDTAPFTQARERPHFRAFEWSWEEQRAYLDEAVQVLGPSPLAEEATRRLEGLRPGRPSPASWTEVPTGATEFETAHVRIAFDAAHGALIRLDDKATGRAWAARDHPLGLIQYQTFGPEDYDRFLDQYVLPSERHEAWVLADQSKPGLEGSVASRRTLWPALSGISRRRDETADAFLLELVMPVEASVTHGAPRRLTLEVEFPDDRRELRMTLQWFDKPACRLPEAVWCSFRPLVAAGGTWWVEKLGQWHLTTAVVPNGNRRLHAVGTGVAYRDTAGELLIETRDAPLVALGEPSLLDFRNELAEPDEGVHINLVNNIWGTNFPQWFEDDARFEMVIRLADAGA